MKTPTDLYMSYNNEGFEKALKYADGQELRYPHTVESLFKDMITDGVNDLYLDDLQKSFEIYDQEGNIYFRGSK